MSSVAKPVFPAPAVEVAEKPSIPWVSLAWFAGLLILCYFPILYRLVVQWNNDDDMGHGFFVPVIAGYIAWQKRDELLRAQLRTNYLGLVVVAFSALQA